MKRNQNNSNSRRDTGLRINGEVVYGHFSDTFDEEIRHNAEHNFGDDIKCKNCDSSYEAGDWDFHQLCPACFTRFDTQKMRGRMHAVFSDGYRQEWFESSDEWVAAQKGKQNGNATN